MGRFQVVQKRAQVMRGDVIQLAPLANCQQTWIRAVAFLMIIDKNRKLASLLRSVVLAKRRDGFLFAISEDTDMLANFLIIRIIFPDPNQTICIGFTEST